MMYVVLRIICSVLFPALTRLRHKGWELEAIVGYIPRLVSKKKKKTSINKNIQRIATLVRHTILLAYKNTAIPKVL